MRLRRRRWSWFLLVACICWSLRRLCTAFVSSAASRPLRGRLAASPDVRSAAPAAVYQAAAGSSAAAAAEPVDADRFRSILITLLQKAGKAEDIIKAGKTERRKVQLLLDGDNDLAVDGSEALDFEEFKLVMQKVDVECTLEETRAVFNALDLDKSCSLEPIEFRKALRSCGAIDDIYREGVRNVLLTLVPTAAAAIGFTYLKGLNSGVDFVTGYIVEDSLSVDNLFVFLLLFKYFKVPPGLQNFCLNIGIFGAVVLRALFIFGGLAVVKAFKPFLLAFAGFLLYSSYMGLTADDDDDDEEDKPPDLVQSVLSYLPTTPRFDGDKLLVQDGNGAWLATPLAVCIIAVELSDILFAVDSVPAIFAVTDDPLIIYTSNIAAIVGLRSLYQVLAIAVTDLVYLDKAVSIVLGFVGLKLGGEVFGFEIESIASLVVIVAILGIGIGASVLAENKSDD
eukprot:TRINITY_DN34393_c0_g2_i1.p1 TRINITY_DN34393_c0_g2~~TRINITY_DN34393_c0_g2_i1.p1  ORF type:complete len:453 (+),score=78.81 TRINITY_DN34393_c0_g2_i1:126-1484(+)